MDENVYSNQNNHKTRNIVIGTIIGLLVLAGISSYIAYQQNEDFKKAVNAVLGMKDTTTTTKSATFAPATTDGVPFVATTKTTNGNESVSGVLTSDGEGNMNYAYQAAGKDASITYTPNAYYVCNDTNQCIRYTTTDTEGSGFDPSEYQFDGSRIEALKSTAAYEGQQTCPAPASGTCEVWSVTEGNVTSTIYVNTETKRVARVTTASGTTKTEATYEYKNATVTIPTNFTTATGTPTPTPTTTPTPTSTVTPTPTATP